MDSLGVALGTGRNVEQALGFFRALADETRLKVIERLREGEQCVCDLTDVLGASQSRMSFHLRVLKDAGLVTDRKDGRWVYYALNTEALALVGRALEDLKPTPSSFRVIRRCD
jgi:ArsR family transcriptional regulator, arsenate/arsenite/antimonite-responsive transcriptional repressor